METATWWLPIIYTMACFPSSSSGVAFGILAWPMVHIPWKRLYHGSICPVLPLQYRRLLLMRWGLAICCRHKRQHSLKYCTWLKSKDVFTMAQMRVFLPGPRTAMPFRGCFGFLVLLSETVPRKEVHWRIRAGIMLGGCQVYGSGSP